MPKPNMNFFKGSTPAGLKLGVRHPSSLTEATLVRAGVTLLYAHWEGFVKNSSLLYLNYINNQMLNYNELRSLYLG